eukprot:3834560-Alexandrium_andersonii.AAC.1
MASSRPGGATRTGEEPRRDPKWRRLRPEGAARPALATGAAGGSWRPYASSARVARRRRAAW